jgi:hypothetical protein
MIGIQLSIMPLQCIRLALVQKPQCPKCHEDLYAFFVYKNAVYECGSCGNIFTSLNERYLLPSTDDVFVNYEYLLAELSKLT